MPRKRTPVPPSAEPDDPAATATIEPSTPTVTDPLAATEPAPPDNRSEQAPAEAPGPETPDQGPSFVERLQQQRRKAPDPFGIAGDYEAGVRLFENRQDKVMAIKFESRPGEPVLEALKDAGYRWNPRDKVWVHPIRPETARATRIDAERLYQEVRGMIRQEKGLESGQEIPF